MVASALVVAVYIFLGGLTSSIYNEVLQFFLIVFGFLPLAILGLKAVGGFAGLEAKLPPGYAHTWANIWHASDNPMGINWFGTIFGLGFVLSFGYWCTDVLVIQRGLAAKDMAAAQRTPLIAAVPKMFFPLLVVLPGLVAISLDPTTKLMMGGRYDNALPAMLGRFYPSGLLGIGLTALLASFMSGMAGNVTAFNTVWTFDIYQTHINPGKPDQHYLTMGRLATIFAVIVGIGTAFIVLRFNNLMDYLQLLFAFFNAPLFGTFLLGMFWKRTTAHSGFWGLLCGIVAAGAHYTLYHFHYIRSSSVHLGILAWTRYPGSGATPVIAAGRVTAHRWRVTVSQHVHGDRAGSPGALLHPRISRRFLPRATATARQVRVAGGRSR